MNKNCDKCDHQQDCKDHFLFCPLDGNSTSIPEEKEGKTIFIKNDIFSLIKLAKEQKKQEEDKPKKCIVCESICPCTCLEVDLGEYGVGYFCSKSCITKFEDEHSTDVEADHICECEVRGYYRQSWVIELQKRYFSYKQLFEEFHKKHKDLKAKVREVIIKNLGIEETPTDGIWKHKAELKIEDIKKIFEELGLNSLSNENKKEAD